MSAIETVKKVLRNNPHYREEFIAALVSFEKNTGYPEKEVRDIVTGPLADEIFMGEKFSKKLQNGLIIHFVYNSKIAREFLLSHPSVPNHVWEPQTTKLLLHFSTGAQNVIIAGAYFGDQAILVAHHIKNTGVCHTFEPNAANSALIRENAAANGLENLLIHQLALWNESGKKLVFKGKDALASTVLPTGNENEVLHTITIDDYMAQQGVGKVELLMIDVEGSELKVLQGATKMLQKYKPVVIFETHSLYDDWSRGLENSPSCRLMKEQGYEIFAVREFHQNIDTGNMPVELLPPERTYCPVPPHHGFNMLAVPSKSLIENDLFRIVFDLSPKLILTKKDPLFFPVNRK